MPSLDLWHFLENFLFNPIITCILTSTQHSIARHVSLLPVNTQWEGSYNTQCLIRKYNFQCLWSHKIEKFVQVRTRVVVLEYTSIFPLPYATHMIKLTYNSIQIILITFQIMLIPNAELNQFGVTNCWKSK